MMLPMRRSIFVYPILKYFIFGVALKKRLLCGVAFWASSYRIKSMSFAMIEHGFHWRRCSPTVDRRPAVAVAIHFWIWPNFFFLIIKYYFDIFFLFSFFFKNKFLYVWLDSLTSNNLVIVSWIWTLNKKLSLINLTLINNKIIVCCV